MARLSGKTGQHEIVLDNRLKAVKLRRDGKSYRKIAAELGVSVRTAHNYVKDALAETVKDTAEAVEAMRALELERLDELHEAYWPLAVVKKKAYAADRILAFMRQRAALTPGLNAPLKQEQSGEIKVTIEYGSDNPNEEKDLDA